LLRTLDGSRFGSTPVEGRYRSQQDRDKRQPHRGGDGAADRCDIRQFPPSWLQKENRLVAL
jgi:hypothetical protein